MLTYYVNGQRFVQIKDDGVKYFFTLENGELVQTRQMVGDEIVKCNASDEIRHYAMQELTK